MEKKDDCIVIYISFIFEGGKRVGDIDPQIPTLKSANPSFKNFKSQINKSQF